MESPGLELQSGYKAAFNISKFKCYVHTYTDLQYIFNSCLYEKIIPFRLPAPELLLAQGNRGGTQYLAAPPHIILAASLPEHRAKARMAAVAISTLSWGFLFLDVSREFIPVLVVFGSSSSQAGLCGRQPDSAPTCLNPVIPVFVVVCVQICLGASREGQIRGASDSCIPRAGIWC